MNLIKKCKNRECSREFVDNTKNNVKLFCSLKCRDRERYLNNPDKVKAWVKRWGLNNPEKRKEITKKSREKNNLKINKYYREKVGENYKNNKQKWDSRTTTNRIMSVKGKHCKECNALFGVEWHHEIYPTNRKDILIAINEGKIYPLCKRCHEKYHIHGQGIFALLIVSDKTIPRKV